ncbi:MAG TPA: hypothetical protein VF412_05195 [Bdellovibrio sp.]|uniref:hypothetical protein n=1 Tax=Bdellovibrio sp. TaxID=28201 RepID=UPI002EF485E0
MNQNCLTKNGFSKTSSTIKNLIRLLMNKPSLGFCLYYRKIRKLLLNYFFRAKPQLAGFSEWGESYR